ncbi:methyltransferase domain-containing protein [Desulfocastanea catecholica]
MNTTTKRAIVEFSVQWQSPYASHRDRVYAGKIDFWRDFFPGNMHDGIMALGIGEKYVEQFAAGVLVPPYSTTHVRHIRKKDFAKDRAADTVTPVVGRYYPQDLAWKQLNCFPGDTTPFRIIGATETSLLADTNHPLARYALTVAAQILDVQEIAVQRGGSLTDIADLICQNGPGMQIPTEKAEMSMYGAYPFHRANTEVDAEFYRTPRLVQHLDDTARRHVRDMYGRLLQPGMQILDLMSSMESHLPGNARDYAVTGLGLNKEEMQRNKALLTYVLQDLNAVSPLPFGDNTFDAVLCTVSIEYLTRPCVVMAEIERVLRPGGVAVVVISDRWFPGKEIEIWPDLHPFERQGYVLNLFRRQKGLIKLHTESIRGYPRPYDDRHNASTFTSDPIFAVWGEKL